MEYQPNKSPDTQPDYEILQGLKEHKAIRKEIEKLRTQGVLETTLSILQEEINSLEERKNELHNQLMNYEGDDKVGIAFDYDKTDQELQVKKNRFRILSQDIDMLDATIQGIEEVIEQRSKLN